MTVTYMLDTNTVSYIARGRSPAARARLIAVANNEIACISAITEAEIRYGLAKRPRATTIRTLMEAFIASIPVLPWSRNEAEAYGLLRAKLEERGLTLGSMDLMIAAHAMAVAAILVTSDQAFRQVDDLLTPVDWASDL